MGMPPLLLPQVPPHTGILINPPMRPALTLRQWGTWYHRFIHDIIYPVLTRCQALSSKDRDRRAYAFMECTIEDQITNKYKSCE